MRPSTGRRRAVIYDHDGTLVDSLDVVVAATNAVLAGHGHPAQARDVIIAGMVHPTGKRLGLLMQVDDEGEQLRLAQAFYDAAYALPPGHARAYAGVAETLEELSRLGFAQAVLSNNQGRLIRRILARLNMAQHMTAMLGEEDMPAPKPDPRGLCAVTAVLNVDVSQAIYVGDTIGDLETAQAAGMSCIAVTWGITERAVLERHDFLAVVHRPADLVNFLCARAPA